MGRDVAAVGLHARIHINRALAISSCHSDRCVALRSALNLWQRPDFYPGGIALCYLPSLESYIFAKFEFFAKYLQTDKPDERAALPVYLGIFVLAQ